MRKLLIITFLILFILKISGNTDIGWIWILSPIWIIPTIPILIYILSIIIIFISIILGFSLEDTTKYFKELSDKYNRKN